MIPVLELEKSGDARFGNSDSHMGTLVPEWDTYGLFIIIDSFLA